MSDIEKTKEAILGYPADCKMLVTPTDTGLGYTLADLKDLCDSHDEQAMAIERLKSLLRELLPVVEWAMKDSDKYRNDWLPRIREAVNVKEKI